MKTRSYVFPNIGWACAFVVFEREQGKTYNLFPEAGKAWRVELAQ